METIITISTYLGLLFAFIFAFWRISNKQALSRSSIVLFLMVFTILAFILSGHINKNHFFFYEPPHSDFIEKYGSLEEYRKNIIEEIPDSITTSGIPSRSLAKAVLTPYIPLFSFKQIIFTLSGFLLFVLLLRLLIAQARKNISPQLEDFHKEENPELREKYTKLNHFIILLKEHYLIENNSPFISTTRVLIINILYWLFIAYFFPPFFEINEPSDYLGDSLQYVDINKWIFGIGAFLFSIVFLGFIIVHCWRFFTYLKISFWK